MFYQRTLVCDVLNFAHAAYDDWTALPLGETIRRMRIMRRLKQGELAEKAGVSPALLSRFERGRIELTPRTLRKIFAVLDCELLILPRPRRPWDRAGEAAARGMGNALREARGLPPTPEVRPPPRLAE